MNPIRSITASLAIAVALASSGNTHAQSGPIARTLQANAEIQSVATKQQQDEVMTLMAAYLGLWSAEDPSRYALEQFLTEDAVFEYPYADDAYRRIEGRKAIGQALPMFPVIASNWKFSDLRLFQTSYSNIFFVEYKASAYVPTTQRTYQARYLARITVRDGKIADYMELWDRDAKAAAFGLPGTTAPGASNQRSDRLMAPGGQTNSIPRRSQRPPGTSALAPVGLSLKRNFLGGKS